MNSIKNWLINNWFKFGLLVTLLFLINNIEIIEKVVLQRSAIEILYFLSGPALVAVAIFALKQIDIAETDTGIRVKRERALATADQLNVFAEKIIPKIDNYNILMNPSFQRINFKLNDFTIEEVTSNSDLSKYIQNIDQFLKKNKALKQEAIYIANQLEYLSFNFIEGVADESKAFSSLSKTFCDFLEWNFFIYCLMRSSETKNFYYYENTIKLYKL